MLLAQKKSSAAPEFQVTCLLVLFLEGLVIRITQIQVSRKKSLDLRCLLILKQACSPECQRAQYAFKDSMIH